MAKQKTMTVLKFQGSKGWLWFWIILFWPIAAAYYLMKRKPVEMEVKKDGSN